MNGGDAEAVIAAAVEDGVGRAKNVGASVLEPEEPFTFVGDAEAPGSMVCTANEENLGNVPVLQEPGTNNPKVTSMPLHASITAVRPPLTCCCGPPCGRRQWLLCS